MSDGRLREGWADDVLAFWFEESEQKDWFMGGAAFDEKIRDRFGKLVPVVLSAPEAALMVDQWTIQAAIIVHDQFTRNLYRGSADAFAGDSRALKLARHMVAEELDQNVPEEQRAFIYMPFMHAEDLAMQEESLRLFERSSYAVDHHRVIEQFGRFPYRNEAIGRKTTPEEAEYLKTANRYGQ